MNWQTADGLWTHLKPLVNQLYYPKHHLETSNRPSQQHKSWKTLAEYLQVTGNESSSPTENTWILMMMTMKMYVVQIRENHKHPSLLCDVETFIITEWRPWGEHEHLSRCANLLKHCENTQWLTQHENTKFDVCVTIKDISSQTIASLLGLLHFQWRVCRWQQKDFQCVLVQSEDPIYSTNQTFGIIKIV